MAGRTSRASFWIKAQPNQFNLTEEGIESPEGTRSSTERATGQNGPDNKKNEKKKLIYKKQT
jgi:hypothetical protein